MGIANRALARRAWTWRVLAAAVVVGSICWLGGASIAATSSTPIAPTVVIPSQPVEAQQFTGNWTQVNDPAATNGTAVVVNSGALSLATTTAPGSYVLNFRVRSGATRIQLTMNGDQVGTAVVYGSSWRTVSVPVFVSGTPTLAVQALPAIGYTPQPLYVDWASLSLAPPGYTTVGNRIVDMTGQPSIPRGVNRNSLEVTSTGWRLSDNDFEAMRLWGVGIVRLPLSQQFWLSSSCSYDPGYAARVDQAVQSITQRGMIALVDLHTTAAGQACGTPYLAPMADDYSVQFWTQVATRYQSNPLVAFDIFNEPRVNDDNIWHDGGMVGTWHAVGMQQLYDTVRATGATNLIFVGGEGWAYRIDVALRHPIDGYGIVYSSHVYNPPGTGPLPSNIDSVILPVAARYPVFFGELGTTAGTSTFNTNAIAYAESHGIGWSAWLWTAGDPSTYALLQSWSTYQPSAAGQPVRDALWNARGWTTWGGVAPLAAAAPRKA